MRSRRYLRWILFGVFLLRICNSDKAASEQASADIATSDASRTIKWSAVWISHPTAPLREPITLHFKRTFTSSESHKHFIIHVSADNRFVLYLNGKRIGDGPARGDLAHWRYETFDLGNAILPGQNTLSATVWNFGVYAPLAQVSDRTAFLVQGDSDIESVINTNSKWFVEIEPGQTIYPRQPHGFWQYMVVGPGERLDASQYDWGWQTPDTTGGQWVAAATAVRESIYPAAGVAGPKGVETDNTWELVPDTLPPMSYIAEEAGHVVRSDLEQVTDFPARAVTVPANTHINILLDRGSITTAYPELDFSGGKESEVEMIYSEALYDAKGQKGDRNEVGIRQALGERDRVLPDGSDHRSFEPLWWRTWRYLDLDITTKTYPLTLEGLRAEFTAYPFNNEGSFHSNDADLDLIWEIGWRTLRLDAHETFSDAPYFEQLQYVGDSRVESMITYGVSRDDRLPRQAIVSIDESRRLDGLTASRYPSSLPQYIPPFSLLWIGMVHDYAEYHIDPVFIRDRMQGVHSVLAWFKPYELRNRMLGKLPYWSFIDWTKEEQMLPSYDDQGQSCTVTLEYLGALEQARDLDAGNGDRANEADESQRAARIKRAILNNCWDAKAGLLADSPAKTLFSQQSNSLGVLYDVVPKKSRQAVMRRILSDTNDTQSALIPATYYFDYYVARALEHAGMGDDYGRLLERWRALLKLHFTTWPETPDNPRSDCHAWSADPTFDLLRIVAGIKPGEAGFKSVRIEPHLLSLTTLDASSPHPFGPIHVHYEMHHGALDATISLPDSLGGELVWKGNMHPLHEGTNTIHLTPAFRH